MRASVPRHLSHSIIDSQAMMGLAVAAGGAAMSGPQTKKTKKTAKEAMEEEEAMEEAD